MFIDDCTYTRNGKTYRRVLLRNSYRVDGTVEPNGLLSPGLGGRGAVPTGPVSGSGKGLGKGATGVVVPVVGLRHRDRPRLAFIGRAAGPAARCLRCPEARSV